MAGFSFGKKICPWCLQYEAARKAEAAGGEHDGVQPVMPAPWLVRQRALPISLTQLFVGINVAVFAAMGLAGISLTEPTSQQLLHWGANYGPLTLGGQWWRLLTSCFLHIGIIHIGFNMWCLWDLGALAEMLYGPWTFAGIYLVSGVAGMVASVGWRFGGISAGASGAIFGLAGALAASFYLGEFSLPRQAIMGQFRSLVVFVGYNLLFGAVAGHIDNAAHIGGLVMGGILGALVARAAPGREAWPRRLAILGAALCVIVASVAALERSHSYLVHLQRGAALLEEKKPADAIRELETSVQVRPTYLPARFELARAYSEQQQWSAAEAQLKRVLELDPRNEDAYAGLAWVLQKSGDAAQARATLLKLLRIDAQSPAGHFGLGNLEFDAGDYRRALQEFTATAQLAPQTEGVNYNIGLCQAKLGDLNAAIDSYRREISISGEDSDTESALAEAYRAKGMTKEAEAAEQKVSKKPSH
ncbi:MAG TPA: rhomboid family intramembrane serine protease [Terriglobales bacterium]|nr:rhomboid family intramembrane serine protease [Terriglobales bacterium]